MSKENVEKRMKIRLNDDSMRSMTELNNTFQADDEFQIIISKIPTWVSEPLIMLQKRIANVMKQPRYELFEAVIGILHTVFLAATMINEKESVGEDAETLIMYVYRYSIFNLFFTVQITMKVLVFGKEILLTFKCLVELVIQLLFL